jgi:hypothetical protein
MEKAHLAYLGLSVEIILILFLMIEEEWACGPGSCRSG